MRIGIPRERKIGECRVAVTPDGAMMLIQESHRIIIEMNAGVKSGYSDAEYRQAGAKIVRTLKEVWAQAELLLKVKEPAPEELRYLRPGLVIFSFLHPAVAPKMTKEMIRHQVIGLDYDLVMLDDDSLPILEPMSIIAGKLSIQCGAYALESANGGRGVLLGGIAGVQAGRVLVLGAGAAGRNAAWLALEIGAEVTVMDLNQDKLAPFTSGPRRARTLYSTPGAIAREIREVDLVIGAVLVPGALAPRLVTREMLKTMAPGSVLVDISIDQGGCAESSRLTSLLTPTYRDSGVLHYCVPNMPALVPRTSTQALTNATLPWVRLIAAYGGEEAVRRIIPLRRSLVTFKGKLTNQAIGEALNIKALSENEVNALIGAGRVFV